MLGAQNEGAATEPAARAFKRLWVSQAV